MKRIGPVALESRGVALPPALWAKIEDAAAMQPRTLNGFLRTLIAEFFDYKLSTDEDEA